MEHFQNDPTKKAIVLNIPLLLKSRQIQACDHMTYYLDVDWETRQTVTRNQKWSDERIKKVENLQIDLDKKQQLAEYTF